MGHAEEPSQEMRTGSAYRVLPRNRYETDAITLVPLRQADLLCIMDWRNAQIDVLRQSRPLTPADQDRYWHDVIVPDFPLTEPRQILFSVLKAGRCVAYGGLVHLDWNQRKGEVSFLAETATAGDQAAYSDLFRSFLAVLKAIAFQDLRLHCLFTETYDIRPHHVRDLEASGFRLEQRIADHTSIAGKKVDSLFHTIMEDGSA